MSRVFRIHTAVLVALCAIFAFGGLAVAQQPGMGMGGMPAPTMPTSLDDAIATLVVGDVSGAIDQVGGVSSQIKPDLGAAALRAKLGEMLGDPSLEGLGEGAGAIMAVFPGPISVTAVEVSDGKIDAYSQSLASGNVVTTRSQGLLLVADNAMGLEAGKAVAQDAAKLLDGAGRPTLKATLFPQKVIGVYGPMVESMLNMMPMFLMSQQSQSSDMSQEDFEAVQQAARMLESQIRGVYSVLGQAREMSIELIAPDGGMQMDLALVPAKDTNLARFAASKTPPAPVDMLAGLPTDGAMRGVAGINMDAYVTFVEAEAEKVATTMKMTEEEKKALRDMLTQSARAYGDRMAVNFFSPGEGFLNGSVIVDVNSPDETLAAIETMTQQMTSGPLASFYDKMGVKMQATLEKNVRSHDGTAIHKLTFQQEIANLPPEQKEAMETIMGSLGYELAFVKNRALFSMGSANMDALVESAKSPSSQATPLSAATAFEPGANAYFDMDLPKLVSNILKPMMATASGSAQGQQMQQIADLFSGFDGTPPVCASASIKPEAMQISLLAPAAFIRKCAEVAQARAATAASQEPEGATE